MSDGKDWPDFGSDNRDELFDFAESLEQRAEAAEARVEELEDRLIHIAENLQDIGTTLLALRDEEVRYHFEEGADDG